MSHNNFSGDNFTIFEAQLLPALILCSCFFPSRLIFVFMGESFSSSSTSLAYFCEFKCYSLNDSYLYEEGS